MGDEGHTWGGGKGSRLRLTSSAAAGSAHLGSEPMTPVSGTICRTFSTGREGSPSSWAVATPCHGGRAPCGAEAEARPGLDSALGPHQLPQGPACPLPGEVPSTSLAPTAVSGRRPSQTAEDSVVYTWQSWDSLSGLLLQELLGDV